jgi:uncharacterized lipoprotein YddW (UPF0748 family)
LHPARALAALAPVLAGLFAPATRGDDDPPPFPREFRAAWVATVGNIDWPTRPGLPAADQRREAVAILDRAASLRLNAVVLQVRPAADALYESRLEPWSAYLSGTQGEPPSPRYDPLQFWADEAHRRGLLLHAWFNPFRARPAGATSAAAPGHVSRSRPDLTRRYGDLLWLDPGEPDAREQTLRVILDVVRRYDVDGVHLDDYFYPYPVRDPASTRDAPRELDFPDEPSWQKYRDSGGPLSRGDWRRDNINRLIEQIQVGVHREKPDVVFGISPFGIARPGRPPGVTGFDQYEKLYADAVLWLRNGWCDYLSPQLYWKIDAPGQPFRPLLGYWVSQNARGRHLWPGLSVSRVSDRPTGYAPEEILGQVAILRETPGATGHIMFSMRALLRDRGGIARKLQDGPYRAPALVPESPWLAPQDPPGAPVAEASARDGTPGLTLRKGPGRDPFLWAVWVRRGSAWSFSTYPAATDRVPLDAPGETAPLVRVAAVDRLGRPSKTVAVTRP